MLPKVLKPIPEPCSVLVLDNCAIHQKYETELRALFEERLGGLLVYLAPPYWLRRQPDRVWLEALVVEAGSQNILH